MLAELDAQLAPGEADELRAVLADLAHQARRTLGEAFVGAYLTGSFALGAGDVHADVDFLVVTDGPPTADQEEAIRGTHRRLPDRAEHWAHVLEGSYCDLADLRGRADPAGSWLYVDNGQREMEWSAHDDTEVARWMLRNRALTIAGPEAASLLPPLPPRVLRDEAARTAVQRRAAALADVEYLSNGWGQPHEVLITCRMLYTATTGAVTDKGSAARWCLEVVPARWHALIEAAVASRPDPWLRIDRPADPRWASLTAPFIDDMVDRITAASLAA